MPSRFSARLVREAAQKFLLPLWNALSFFTIYANLDGWRPGAGPGARRSTERPALDRWVLLRLDRLTEESHGAARRLRPDRRGAGCRGVPRRPDELVHPPQPRPLLGAATAIRPAPRTRRAPIQALYEVLTTLARLVAPFTPFVAEVLHEHLVRSQRPRTPLESVHLEDWPEPPKPTARTRPLEKGMAAVQRIVRLGHAARNLHGLKTRQPLAAVTLVTADESLRGAGRALRSRSSGTS